MPEHSDDEPVIRPHSQIFTFTLGQAVPIVFTDKITKEEVSIEPVEGSLFVMSMESQYFWTHKISPVNLDNNPRFSITIRSVGQNFKNST